MSSTLISSAVKSLAILIGSLYSSLLLLTKYVCLAFIVSKINYLPKMLMESLISYLEKSVISLNSKEINLYSVLSLQDLRDVTFFNVFNTTKI